MLANIGVPSLILILIIGRILYCIRFLKVKWILNELKLTGVYIEQSKTIRTLMD